MVIKVKTTNDKGEMGVISLHKGLSCIYDMHAICKLKAIYISRGWY